MNGTSVVHMPSSWHKSVEGSVYRVKIGSQFLSPSLFPRHFLYVGPVPFHIMLTLMMTHKASRMNYGQIVATKYVIIRIVSNFTLVSRIYYGQATAAMTMMKEKSMKKVISKKTLWRRRERGEAWRNFVRIFGANNNQSLLNASDWLVIKQRTQHLHLHL